MLLRWRQWKGYHSIVFAICLIRLVQFLLHSFPRVLYTKNVLLVYNLQQEKDITMRAMLFTLRLGLGQRKNIKKGLPSPRAGAGQENIETVHEPKPIQTTRSPWGQGRRAMGGPQGPQTLVCEGAYAIKVSMRIHVVLQRLLNVSTRRTDHSI